jgi:protein-disulfide isomerase
VTNAADNAKTRGMSETQSTSRLPLFVGMAALALLGSGGAYLLSQSRAGASGDTVVQAKQVADSAIAQAGMSDEERKATEAVVRAYILEHPEILSEAAKILQQREATKRLTAAGSMLTKPFAGAVAGNPNGDVTLVEFTDYSCGFCRASLADVQKLIGADKGIRVVFREVPILSPASRDAAKWALAAAKQGKHKAFHEAMFAGEKPAKESILLAARKAGLDMARAEKDANSDEVSAEIEANLAMMQQIGFNGTPTFIVGDQILEGAMGYDALNDAVTNARKAS